ncbi:MAG: hypothetical protein HYX53_18745 [Chloroflexi bacterium]|nr:hypothetical protein [Chloroflexota bacterium]
MPDRGLLERSAIHAQVLGGTHPAPWTLTGVRWAQLTFEVGREAALATMPADVSRPVPCYARLLVLAAEVSPAGPLRLAALMTGGRYKMMPKNVLVDAIVDGPADDVAAAFGAPYRSGRISLGQDGSRVVAEISDGELTLGTLMLPAIYAIDPGMLRWDPWLGFTEAGVQLQIVEYGPQVQASEAFLSKGATLETPVALPRTNQWRKLRNINTISASYGQGEITLTAPEVQQAIL